MEKQMTMPANMATRRDPQNANKLTAMACRNAGLLLMRPLKWLQHYYSDTMKRPFTMSQTLLLTETQLAFAATAGANGHAPAAARRLCGMVRPGLEAVRQAAVGRHAKTTTAV